MLQYELFIYMHVCTCARAHVCTCACVHVCTCARVHMFTCARVHVCTCARVHICMYACMQAGMLTYPLVYIRQPSGDRVHSTDQ